MKRKEVKAKPNEMSLEEAFAIAFVLNDELFAKLAEIERPYYIKGGVKIVEDDEHGT